MALLAGAVEPVPDGAGAGGERPARRVLVRGGPGVHRGKAVQVELMKSMLKAPGTKRLKLKYDKTAFKICFQFQLAPLHRGHLEPPRARAGGAGKGVIENKHSTDAASTNRDRAYVCACTLIAQR